MNECIDLFDDTLGNANNFDELSSVIKKHKELDPMYVSHCICSSDYYDYKGNKRKRNKWYNKNKEYLDDNFINEFKLKDKFKQRLWELYMVTYIRNKRYTLKSNKEGQPDICIERGGGNNIWIECTLATRGKKGNSEMEKVYNKFNIDESGYSGDLDKVDKPRKLRLTSRLDAKKEKINTYKDDGIIKDGDCVIIALNGGLVDGNFINNGIESILFGIGKTQFDKEGNKSYESKLKAKKNDSDIDFSIFNNKEYDNISGLIYSVHSVYNFKYNGLSLDGNDTDKFSLIKNPRANNKIPKGFLEEIISNR